MTCSAPLLMVSTLRRLASLERLDETRRAQWDEPMHRFVLRLPLRLAKAYWAIAKERHISLNALLVEALEAWLVEHGPRQMY